MSRIGKQPITVPSGVTVTPAADGITVTGPKGTLQHFNLPGISLDIKDGEVEVKRANDEAATRARHGLMRALLSSMVTGVSQGFERKLEINGVGYRVNLQGQELKLSLGFSHDVTYKLPEGISASIDQNVISITGINKQLVGQVAAEIRALKKPEPYKGKGIKYIEERIVRKSGKSGKEATTA